MSWLELSAIWLAWVLAGGSPGPATLGIASTAMALGRRAGLLFALGILTGGAIYAITLPPTASGADIAFMFCFLYSGRVCVFLSYAVLFSSPKVVRVYTRMRRGFEAAFALLFGAAGLKILTTRVAP